MVTEIRPNTWYTMDQAFGDSLFVLDTLWTKEEEPTRILAAIRQAYGLLNSATFKGSKFSPMFDQESFSLEQLAKTDDGEPIYFPVDRPSYADMTGTYGSAAALAVRTGRYSPLDFMIDQVLEEDLIGEFFISYKPSHVFPDGRGTKAKNYRYQMLLRSNKGIFVSDAPAVFDEDHPLPYVGFDRWRPIDSEKLGLLYVPLEYKKAASLEIMLQQK